MECIELDGKIDLTEEQKHTQVEYEERVVRCDHTWGKVFIAHSSISETRLIRKCSSCNASQYGYNHDWTEPIGLLEAPRRDYIINLFKVWNFKGEKWEDAQQGYTERFWYGKWESSVGGGYSLLTRKQRAAHDIKCQENVARG